MNKPCLKLSLVIFVIIFFNLLYFGYFNYTNYWGLRQVKHHDFSLDFINGHKNRNLKTVYSELECVSELYKEKSIAFFNVNGENFSAVRVWLSRGGVYSFSDGVSLRFISVAELPDGFQFFSDLTGVCFSD